ncbi:MAG: DNA recombination protein RmuC [Salinivirgaceae bacterium]|jgi:DNA recombination protein RmuC|nr:DNA recombination protein RmuC [Salinivirgaceae bacterium]
MDILLLILAVIIIALLVTVLLIIKNNNQSQTQLLSQEINRHLKQNKEEMWSGFQQNRQELSQSIANMQQLIWDTLQKTNETQRTILEQLTQTLNDRLTQLTEKNNANALQAREHLATTINKFQESFDKNVASFNTLQREKFAGLEKKQDQLVANTEKRLEQMRETVEEKLQKTLNERIGQSFETVGKQLLAVQQGLGEMKNLAQDVGGLKKVLSNVKNRGGLGEMQLSLLLEQILAPQQYETNVKTKPNSNDHVEFAIKLPGKDDIQSHIWLPIDAKFPKDTYENLQEAYDEGDPKKIEQMQKILDTTIKNMAKDIHDKYIDPPHTTDFGILFVPFESIYAEVVRKASLLEELQNKYKIVVTGPTTLAAILNSLQMGFRTLAIQKRSSEVWDVLSAVKNEFTKFGGLLEKAQKNIRTGMNTLDDLSGKRTRAIERTLRKVETSKSIANSPILDELTAPFDENDA